MSMNKRKKARGFTLIELVIAVAIVGILSTLAYSSYIEQVRKSRRAEGKATLLNLASRMERFYADQSTYTGATVAALLGSTTTENGYYTISINPLAAESYTLLSAPANDQVNDTRCGTFSLTSLNVKGATGTLGAAPCW
jgi:type IV pilus assembly protein PilE